MFSATTSLNLFDKPRCNNSILPQSRCLVRIFRHSSQRMRSWAISRRKALRKAGVQKRATIYTHTVRFANAKVTRERNILANSSHRLGPVCDRTQAKRRLRQEGPLSDTRAGRSNDLCIHRGLSKPLPCTTSFLSRANDSPNGNIVAAATKINARRRASAQGPEPQQTQAADHCNMSRPPKIPEGNLAGIFGVTKWP